MAGEQDHFRRTLDEHRACMKVLAGVENGLSLQPEFEPRWRSKLLVRLEHFQE